MSINGGGGAIGGSVGPLSEHDRRLLRLRQVREQSKDIAKKLRIKWKDEQSKFNCNSKQMEFENFNTNTKQSLKSENKNRYQTISSDLTAVMIEENQKKDWLKQKELNINKARERGKIAFNTMRKNKMIQGNGSKKLEYRRWELPRKSRSPTISNNSKKSPTDKINQFYEESDGADDCCSNFQHRLEINSNNRFPLSIPDPNSSDRSNKKRVTISEELKNADVGSVPENEISVTENIPKSSERESTHKSQEQLSIIDIQQALCDCQPRFKSIAKNVEHLFNNNHKDKQMASESVEKVSYKTNTIDQLNKSDKHNDSDESTKFIPLTIISDYLKSRNMCFENNNIKRDIVEIDGHVGIEKSLTEQSSKLKFNSSVIENSLLKSNKINRTTNPKSSHINVKKTSFKNISLSKPIQSKSNLSKQDRIVPSHSARSINSYDQVNKFSKKMYINDKCLVKRLPREIHNAYENARKEMEDEEAIASAIQAAKMNDKSKSRGMTALEKVRAQDDYKNLLEELEILTKEERFVGKGFPDKIFQNTTRIQDEIKHQNFMNMSMKHMCSELQTDKKIIAKPSETNSNSEKLYTTNKILSTSNLILNDHNDTSVNVATWEVSNDLNWKNKSDVSLKGCENSMQSIVYRQLKNTKVDPNYKEKVTKMKSKEKLTPNNETEDTFNSPTKSVEKEHDPYKIHTKSLKTPSAKKYSLISNNKEIDNVSSTTNIVSFEGLQIVIEVKNAKKGTSKTKNEEVQTADGFDLSGEVSIKTSKVVSKREITVEKINHNSSESTTYMSPPEKLTTRFDKMFLKGFPNSEDNHLNSNISHTSVLVKKDVAVNTDNIKIPSHLKILEHTGDFRKPSENSVNKGTQIDFIDVNTESNTNLTEKSANQPNLSKKNVIESDVVKKDESDSKIKRKTQLVCKETIKTSDESISAISLSDKIIGKCDKMYQNSSNNSEISHQIETETDLTKYENSNRILDLSQKLNEIMREKHSFPSSNATNSSEEFIIPQNNKKSFTDIAFVPLLADIPKPKSNENKTTSNDNEFLPKLPEFNMDQIRKAKPTLNRNKDILDVTPRELSTIIEVDTPATARNSSSHFRNVNPSLASAKLDKHFDFSNIRDSGKEIALNLPDLSIPKLEDRIDVEVNFNSFASFKDFIRQRRNETNLERFSSKGADNTSSSDDSLRALAVNLLKQNVLKKSKRIKSNSSSSSISETIVSNKSMILQKSESNNSSSQLLFDKSELSRKTTDRTIDTVGLSTLQDDLNLSDELLIEKKIIESISNSSLYKNLDNLIKTNVSKMKEKSNEENYPILVNQATKSMINSQDKTQQRTSTPVHFKSSSSNARNSSNGGSNYLFSADSDISSVKNNSNSDKTVYNDRLSVPNVSLKFGKLFDSCTLNADTQ